MVRFELDLDTIYPIGSIYLSINGTNPKEYYGGEWERIEDKFLLACGTKHPNGSTGGSEDAIVVSHNHTQNAHSHGTKYDGNSYVVKENSTGASNRRITVASSGSTYVDTSSGANFHNYNATDSQTPTINSKGESGTGKNMPPFLAVYMWVRTG